MQSRDRKSKIRDRKTAPNFGALETCLWALILPYQVAIKFLKDKKMNQAQILY